MDEFERVGRILAADQKLKVHVRGGAAFAVPGEVTIPSPDVWHVLGRHAVRMLHGLLDHETAHSKWSDFDLFKAVRSGDHAALARRGVDTRGVKMDVLASLFNMLEDARIEARQAEAYPGARENLTRKNAWMWETDTAKCPSVQKRVQSEPLIQAYMLAGCMISRGTKTPADFAGTQVEDAVALTLPELQAAAPADSSIECLRLALTVYRKLAEGRSDDDDKDAPSEGGKSKRRGKSTEGDGSKGEPEDSDEDSDDSEGGGSEDEDGEDEGDGGESGGDGEDDEDPASEGEDGEEASEDKKGSKPCEPVKMDELRPGLPLDPESMVNGLIKALLESDALAPYVIFDREYDWEVNLETAEGEGKHDYVAQAEVAVGSLVQAFEVALRAKREKRLVSGYDEGEADGSLLASFSLGATPVDEMWMQPVAEDDREVAVSILVDCSGSMGTGPGSKAACAQVATAALSQALSAVQVPHEIVGFTSVASAGYEGHRWVVASKEGAKLGALFASMGQALDEQEKRGISPLSFARECYRRRREILLTAAYAVFKGFNTSHLSGLQHIAGIHENLDGEAVLWAAKRLAERPEPRRVLMVLSDGLPAGANVPDGGKDFLRQVVSEVTAAGIEVLGIGIATNAVTRFYPHSIEVSDVESLGQVAVTELVQVLLASRQETDEVVL